MPQAPQEPAADGAAEKRRIGDYVLESQIGKGGMGMVFVARRQSDGAQVALKVLNPAFAGDKEKVTRFSREGQFMLQLEHPHLVRAFELKRAGNTYYLAMEYVPGETLKDRLLRDGCVEPTTAMRMMRQIASALDYGARRGMIHRDLKPENVLVRTDGVAKLVDMGLAILANRPELRLTIQGFAAGTPMYMSPEQAQARRDIDARSDVYSLGCTFYHAMCGRPPFEGNNPIVIMDQHVKASPPRPSEILRGVPGKVEAVLLRCLEKEPDKRFQSCAELIEAIDWAVGPPPEGEVAAQAAAAAAPVPAAAPAQRPSSRRAAAPASPAGRAPAKAKPSPMKVLVYVLLFLVLAACGVIVGLFATGRIKLNV